MTRRILGIAAVAAIISSGTVSAQQIALDVVRQVDAAMAVDTSRTEIRMRTYPDAANDRDYREFSVLSWSRGEGETYMEFMEPRSIRGLRVLSLGGDNWLYFPSTGRVRKIAASSKGESVQGVGGDFSYEDLGGGKLEEDYDFRLRSEDGRAWILDGTAKRRDSVYSAIVLEVSKANRLPTRIEYHTPGDGHLKTLVLSEVKTVGGRLAATTMTMTNHKRGSRTVVQTLSASYGVEIPDKLLNPTQFYR